MWRHVWRRACDRMHTSRVLGVCGGVCVEACVEACMCGGTLIFPGLSLIKHRQSSLQTAIL